MVHETQTGPKLNVTTNLVLVIALVLAALLIVRLYTQVEMLKAGVPARQGTAAQAAPDNAGNVGTAGKVQAPSPVTVDPVTDKDFIRGDKKSRIVLIEYSDFECPFCKSFHPTAKQVVDTYKGQVAWVYRNFPLEQIHPKARKLAETGECVAEMGGTEAFWKYADKIYNLPSVSSFDMATLPDFAADLGIDKTKFKDCIDSGRLAKLVEADYQSGIKAGVNGTPGNILLDTKTGKTQMIPGAVPFEQLKQAIDGMLSQG